MINSVAGTDSATHLISTFSSRPPPGQYTPGSEADFIRLYEASAAKILGTLRNILGNNAAAEDVCQDTFERAYRSWPSWTPTAPAEAWLHRIAVNSAISYQRYSRIREAGEIVRRIGRPSAPLEPSEVAERSELAVALLRLPVKQSTALVLRHYHGFSNREIGLARGIPERTIASRLAAAKVTLRVMLRTHESGPTLAA